MDRETKKDRDLFEHVLMAVRLKLRADERGADNKRKRGGEADQGAKRRIRNGRAALQRLQAAIDAESFFP